MAQQRSVSGVPPEAYCPSSPVLAASIQSYPLLLDVHALVYLLFAPLPLAPFTISIKSDGLLFSTTKVLPITTRRFTHVADQFKRLVADLAFTYFTPQSQSQYYTRLLPLILSSRFRTTFAVSLNPPLVVWKRSSSILPSQIKTFVEEIVLVKHPVSGFGLDVDGGLDLDADGLLFTPADFSCNVKFTVPVNVPNKFVFRKFNFLVQRDMKLCLVSCPVPELTKGVFSPDTNAIPFVTVNALCKREFLDRLQHYASHVVETPIHITYEPQYVVELCKAFNLLWMAQPVMVRFVKPRDDNPGGIVMIYVFAEDKQVFIDSLYRMNANHRSFELKRTLTPELIEEFQRNGVSYTYKNNRLMLHTFTREAAAYLHSTFM